MTNYPSALDALTNPTGANTLDNPNHADQHANANDAIEAIQTKVGVDGSAVTTSHDYKLSGVTGSDKAVSKTGTETLTNKTITAPVLSGTATGTYTLAGTPTITAPVITNPTLTVDTVSEFTGANGVTVDGLNIKDSKLVTADSVVTTNITNLAVTTAKIAANAVTAAKIETQESWIAPTLTNSWVNYGAPFNDAGYYKDSLGTVHLRGLVRNGTDGATIFTLPAGYRPAGQELLVVGSADLYGRLDISTAGAVTPAAITTSPTWVSLDGLTFRAA